MTAAFNHHTKFDTLELVLLPFSHEYAPDICVVIWSQTS